MTERWYVVHTKHKQEQTAAENLWDQGFPVFYPRYIKEDVKAKTVQQRVLPFYPGYIFVRFDIGTSPWKRICSTRGIVQLVCATEENAVAVPPGFVEDLILQCDKEGFIPVNKGVEIMQSYTPGELLQVKDGPFAGLIGVCEQSDNERVRIFLSLLSRETTVSLTLSSVQRNKTTSGSVV